MTTLEVILIIILWVNLGFFLAYKRNWYPEKSNDDMPSSVRITFSVVLAPLNFLVIFVQVFLINKWNNE